MESAAQNFSAQCGIGAVLQRVPNGGLDSSSVVTRVAVANPLPLMTKAELQAELRYERLASSPGKRFCLFHFPRDFSSHIVSVILD
jgi:hypothetical protein